MKKKTNGKHIALKVVTFRKKFKFSNVVRPKKAVIVLNGTRRIHDVKAAAEGSCRGNPPVRTHVLFNRVAAAAAAAAIRVCPTLSATVKIPCRSAVLSAS